MKKSIRKIISAVIAASMLPAAAFAWQGEEEVPKRTQMVTANELDVYVEGPTDKAPYYGARLEPRSGVYFGTLSDHCDIMSDFSTCLTYMEFDAMQEDMYYPANDMVRKNNMNAMIGWNVSSPDTIRNIASYTDYIDRAAKTLNAYGKNIYLRFGGEMNDLDLGSGEEFKNAFRTVANIVHKYENLAMVWSPVDMGSLEKPFINYYPGDEYVDWIGVSSYRIKYFMLDPNTSALNKTLFMTGEYAWHTNAVKPILAFMAENNIQKPVMISEGGVAVGNKLGEDTSAWAAPRLRNMYWDLAMKYPQIKMINYFNTQMSWEDNFFSLDGHNDLIAPITEATHSGAFITRNAANKFTFTDPKNAGTLTGPKINVYSHAYSNGSEYVNVDYYLDGTLYKSCSLSPYNITIDLSALSDGNHKLEVSSHIGGSIIDLKSYDFKKLGAFARFGGEIVNNKAINVSVNGKQIAFDVPPCVIADRTLVPIRAFANALGISDDDISYNGSEQTVAIKNGGDEIKLYINNPLAYVNGTETKIDAPPTVIDGRTLVPLRFISENFNCNVDYTDSDSALNVFLTSK